MSIAGAGKASTNAGKFDELTALSKLDLKSLTSSTSVDYTALKRFKNSVGNENFAKMLVNLENGEAVKLLKKMKLSDDEIGSILRNMDDSDASKIATDLGKKWDTKTKALVAATTVATGAGATVAILKKLKDDADGEVEKCVDACLPEGWEEHENGTLSKDSLKYSEIKSTRKQPICKKTINDCGEFCGKKCEEEHGYKPPFEILPEITGNPFKGIFNPINDFFKNIFGDGAKYAGIMSSICLFIIIIGLISMTMLKT